MSNLTEGEELLKIIENGGSVPEDYNPGTNTEKFLSAMLGIMDKEELPKPISRVDALMKLLNEELNKIRIDKYKKYELIEEITVSEDGVSVIERTQEPDGTAYNLRCIYIRIDVEPHSDAIVLRSRVKHNNLFYQVGYISMPAADDKRYTSNDIKAENGMLTGSTRTPSTSVNGNATISSVGNFFVDIDAVRELILMTDSGFPIGTKIFIYGIRK